ncbi:MAG: acetyl-CoA carboxylase biotin carboxyl carrier protein [Clostridia bacterium]|mgnify:CR=1 FL=1|jgi:acetyl-CoA carboxylase biotin carboxyl carrier protein|nr:acetyl-CoA carboxylase biotin carboxyl carrier protein [Clostridia bacterium]MBT7122834.1 acetyl-CoA carboxylase biotin carboxyl carrier protein [Clostridia bacterium]
MDLDKIFSLMDKAEKSSFNKIEIQIGDTKLSLDRSTAAAVVSEPAAQAPSAPAKEIAKEIHIKKEDVVPAPISGVFYIAKAPGEPAFVSAGDSVKKGETICIIEAMKTMNEIVAPKSGVIESILVSDGDSVIANQPLFKYAEGK